MLSRILSLEDLAQRSIMYWLPPGGRYNGVFAATWVILAELEAHDADPILARLADADIGAYAGKASAAGGRPLYVDVMQYNQAVDVLMGYLRGRDPGPR